jgi:hypothetical protein
MAKTPKKAKPAKPAPPLDPPALARRLAWLRRRLRFVATFRGVSWLLVLVLATLLLVGLLDWRVHLPALVRAVALVGVLSGSGYIVIRHLLRPLATKSDDLTLALRVEKQYPGLNDSLASTVEFLQESDKPGLDSPGLRKEAVKHALRRARGVDFGTVVDSRGLRTAGLLMAVACAAAVAAVLLWPQLAFTALARLLAPFSAKDWPSQTQLDMAAPRDRIGRNELFEVKGTVRGIVPETANVIFKIDNGQQVEHTYEIAPGPEQGTGLLTVRLEPGRAKNSFSFEVRANDAVYRSKIIRVSPPPLLTMLDGRPSPQVHLDFPPYTDLPPQDLPDGSGNIDAVAGTIVTLRAAADRPLQRAWIEFLPEAQHTSLAAFLGPLGSGRSAQVWPLTAGGQAVWDIVPAQLEEDRQRFGVRFRPHVSGMYQLHFEDESGLANSRLFELRVQVDPPPTVALERPSPSRDILDLLPDADVPLQAMVTDPHYAVRAVFLEYRCQKTDALRAWPIWDHHTAGVATAKIMWPFGKNEPVRLRLVAVPINQTVPLNRFRHVNGAPLREGDALTLQLCADDFDDVSVDKEPGRSHEVEIRIISRNALDVLLNQEEAKVQQDLVRLEKMQRAAKQKVVDTQNQLRKTGKLQTEDVSRLLDAEQEQQQIRERIGDKQEGLRSEVARILDTLKNNKLPRSGTHDRMERVQSSLDRLGREELPQIEPRLTNARKEAENQDSGVKNKERPAQREEAARQKEKEAKAREQQAQDKDKEAKQAESEAKSTPDSDPKKAERQKEAKQLKQDTDKLRQQAEQLRKDAEAIRKGEAKDAVKQSLAEARAHQEEVQRTLSELLQALDSFASTAGIKGEAKSILERQTRLNQETEEFVTKHPDAAGKEPEKLSNADAIMQLQNLKNDQSKLEEDTNKLLNQMEKVRDTRRKEKDDDTANQLDKAIQQANKGNLTGAMREALEHLKENQTQQAGGSQRDAISQLKKVIQELEDRRAADLDRLAKKLREKQDQLEKLAQEQERLQKKVQEAKQIADPKTREEELKRLAKRQKELKEQTEDLARQLSRLRQDRAGQAASQAAGQMEQALKQLERGQDAEEEQDEALDRLDEAQREVERTKEETEEELAREQAAKAAEEIKRLKQRHEGLMAEAARLERAVLEKGWVGSLLRSMLDLSRTQKELADATASLAEKKQPEAQVLARVLHRAAEIMNEASARFKERAVEVKEAPDARDLPGPPEEAVKLQKDALRRLDQLLEALKQEPGMVMRPAGGGGGGGGDGGSGGGGGGEGIPPVVQYKLLRAMQAEINQKTDDFARKHPDAKKLTKQEQDELAGLQEEQKEIADLVEKIAEPEEEGDKP